jgi:DNA-binding response OmpR family regulator
LSTGAFFASASGQREGVMGLGYDRAGAISAAILRIYSMPIDPSSPGPSTAPPPAGVGVWRLVSEDSSLRTPRGMGMALTPAEYAVLRLLLATPGHQVPRNALIAAVTDDASAFDPHRLEMLIHRLRNKVVDSSGERLPVRAVRGEGYVLLGQGPFN